MRNKIKKVALCKGNIFSKKIKIKPKVINLAEVNFHYSEFEKSAS